MVDSPTGAAPRDVVSEYLMRIFPGEANAMLRIAILNMKQAIDLLPEVSRTFNDTLTSGLNQDDAALRLLEAINVTAFLAETMAISLQRSRDLLQAKLDEGNVCMMPRRIS